MVLLCICYATGGFKSPGTVLSLPNLDRNGESQSGLKSPVRSQVSQTSADAVRYWILFVILHVFEFFGYEFDT